MILICPKGCGLIVEAPPGSTASHHCPKVVKKDDEVLLVEEKP